MNCIKCGRAMETNQTFCDECMERMASAPVKPGTRIVIPKRPEPVATVPSKQITQEEILENLRRHIRILRVFVVILLLLLGVTSGILAYHFSHTNHSGFGIGSNYHTSTASESTPIQ